MGRKRQESREIAAASVRTRTLGRMERPPECELDRDDGDAVHEGQGHDEYHTWDSRVEEREGGVQVEHEVGVDGKRKRKWKREREGGRGGGGGDE